MTTQPEYKSSLSTKRIVISLLIFFLIPIVKTITNQFVHNDTISYTMALNLAGALLIIYDWNLFGIHYNRSKKHLADTMIYMLIGMAVIGLWVYVDLKFLQADILISDPASTKAYLFGSPAIMLAFSFIQGAIINISFKCVTDRMNIQNRELIVILVSGFLFGLIYTIAFLSTFTLDLFIRTYLYNVVLIAILSYLYNQSHSFIPGILSFGIIMIIVQLYQLFLIL
ncbi:MAG: hypothetical protein LKF50_05700 [Solobacterium sp.]|jgi:hypothetical protein|nr:hypothetical protein [Solobacterium sp.]MCH4223056.1 hypothetical protein [Solobacterium sp.]